MKLLLIIFVLKIFPSFAYNNSDSYNLGKEFSKNGVKLSNPRDAQFKDIIKDGDIRYLKDLNDTSIEDMSIKDYKSLSIDEERNQRKTYTKHMLDKMQFKSKEISKKDSILSKGLTKEDFLNLSNQRKDEAYQEYQINNDNKLLKDSNKIETDALKVIDNKAEVTSFYETEGNIKKCIEGSEINIEIERKLILELKKRKFKTTNIHTYIPDSVNTSFISYIFLGKPLYEANLKVINKNIDKFFSNIDVLNNKKHNILFSRVKDYNVVEIVKNKNNVLINGTIPSHVLLIKYNHDTYDQDFISKEYKETINSNDEKLLENSNCQEINRTCIENGYRQYDEIKIERPCWHEKINYSCIFEPSSGCSHLKNDDCEFVSSKCIQGENPCLKWERTYNCKVVKEKNKYDMGHSDIYCIEGNCYEPLIKKNTDIYSSVSKLAAISEMKQEFKSNGSVSIFKGEIHKCSNHILDFCNCCISFKGWGSFIGLHKCSSDEKILAQKRDKNLCHYVGTYCANRVLGVCVRELESYCCFSSKLSRLFHEHGRRQIGMSFGSASSPNCRGLSIEEVGRIKLDKIDFSEIYGEIYKNTSSNAKKPFPKIFNGQIPKIQKDAK